MMPVILIIVLMSAFLLLSLFIYIFIYSRANSKSSCIYGKQRIKYSIQPSIDIITRRLSSYRANYSAHDDSNQTKLNQSRSFSLANNLFVTKCSNRRPSAIIDSKQMAQIQFALPPSAEIYRRRSIAICNNIIDGKHSTIDSIINTIKSSNQFLPCVVSFSITYLKSAQIQIHFHSLTSLPSTIQQLTIKIKLIPDGKVKEISIKKFHSNENIFAEEINEYSVQFSHISPVKLHEKTLIMKFHGKDQSKKTIHLGQVGKIHFNELENISNENPIDFIHEIEPIRMSSIEILVSLELHNDHNLIVDIKRIKGLKIDQKHLTATCFFRIILLDRHRPLSTHETKLYRLNSSTFSLDEPSTFNILAFNSNNLDRIMIMIKLYSNANHTNEHHCIARIKFASSYLCSGSGTIHWQQFKERQSFSMWHSLIKH